MFAFPNRVHIMHPVEKKACCFIGPKLREAPVRSAGSPLP